MLNALCVLLTFKQANPVRVTSVVSLFCVSKYVLILSWVTAGGTCLCSVINGEGYEVMATATGIGGSMGLSQLVMIRTEYV